VTWQPYGDLPPIIALANGDYFADASWYRQFQYDEERARGLDFTEDLAAPGKFTFPLSARAVLAFGTGSGAGSDIALPLLNTSPERCWDSIDASERRRRAAFPSSLHRAADDYIVARGGGKTIIAGYPWFGDWGRDTMISLPGLTLATGRADVARRILKTFASFVSEGMLPNVFPGAGDHPAYNTADASLWFFEAWRAYVDATGDVASLREVFPVLSDMIGWHQRGTRYGIGVDATDGLLKAGVAGVQLTWMDAKVGDWVVTPRIGKPVEINALWYNALRVMSAFATLVGEPDHFSAPAEAAKRSFARFVRADGDGLFDVIDGPQGDDASIRPNQIFAVSLPHSPLAPDAQARTVQVCRRHLLTAFGLRSLAPGSPGYHPAYGGGVLERDGGYHQGPVWGWLLGPFCLAAYRVSKDAIAARAVLDAMSDALEDQGIGTIGEIFDGEAPHRPRGAPAQAWSVACTLDAWRLLTQAVQSKQT